jgi:hypothetical protein
MNQKREKADFGWRRGLRHEGSHLAVADGEAAPR